MWNNNESVFFWLYIRILESWWKFCVSFCNGMVEIHRKENFPSHVINFLEDIIHFYFLQFTMNYVYREPDMQFYRKNLASTWHVENKAIGQEGGIYIILKTYLKLLFSRVVSFHAKYTNIFFACKLPLPGHSVCEYCINAARVLTYFSDKCKVIQICYQFTWNLINYRDIMQPKKANLVVVLQFISRVSIHTSPAYTNLHKHLCVSQTAIHQTYWSSLSRTQYIRLTRTGHSPYYRLCILQTISIYNQNSLYYIYIYKFDKFPAL